MMRGDIQVIKIVNAARDTLIAYENLGVCFYKLKYECDMGRM
jgi:hypothetical protein